jgi:hypothetical protein
MGRSRRHDAGRESVDELPLEREEAVLDGRAVEGIWSTTGEAMREFEALKYYFLVHAIVVDRQVRHLDGTHRTSPDFSSPPL